MLLHSFHRQQQVAIIANARPSPSTQASKHANAFRVLQNSPTTWNFLSFSNPPLFFRSSKTSVSSIMENPSASATTVQDTHHPPPLLPPPAAAAAAPRCIHQVVRRLIASLVLLFVLASAVCFITWLMLHPHPPVFRVNSLAVSSFNISSLRFAPRYDLELGITNPNKKIAFFIDHFGLLVSYRGIPLLRRVMKPTDHVEIPSHQSSEIRYKLDTEKLNDKKKRKVLRDMEGDWSKGVVSFEVKVNVRVEFRVGTWLSRQRLVEASCKDLSIEFLPAKDTGKLHDRGGICLVD